LCENLSVKKATDAVIGLTVVDIGSQRPRGRAPVCWRLRRILQETRLFSLGRGQIQI